jgi:hypothetical protein
MFSKLEGDKMFTDKTLFSDEATFHLSGNSNKNNLGISGINNPHAIFESTQKRRVPS